MAPKTMRAKTRTREERRLRRKLRKALATGGFKYDVEGTVLRVYVSNKILRDNNIGAVEMHRIAP